MAEKLVKDNSKDGLQDLCKEYKLKINANKDELAASIAEVRILEENTINAMKVEVDKLFSNYAPSHSIISNFYRTNFNKLDRFNALYYL